MNRWRWFLLVLTLQFTSGCASLWQETLNWNARIVAPKHYDVWVDFFDMETTGVRRWRVPAGYVSCCWRTPSGKGGGGYEIPPPNFFLVRWFSFAEQKFYGRLVELPANLEERMRYKTPVHLGDGRILLESQRNLIIGLAPGGQIVVWIMNQEQNAEEILRIQAFEEKVDPSQYQVRSKNYEARHGDYIKQHGIPLTGW